jgi:outer membrane lipoprotein-sorting protein
METENQQQVTRALDDVGNALRRQPSVRDEVMRRITQQVATGVSGATTQPARWGGRRLIGRVVAVAACVAIGLVIWNPWGRGVGASEAFAAAIANVERASTFACRQIVTEMQDGQPEVREMTFMFKEPNLERQEFGEGMPTPNEVMITDYAKKVRLIVLPEDKSAALQDLSTLYTTDEKTGELKSVELGTHARDDVLRISAQAVKDLGNVNIDGREVRVLQSADGVEPIKTVYVNPVDGKPVRVELSRPSTGGSFVYTDIRMDIDLDDKLFSLEPPAGYALQHDGPVKPVDDMNGKMMGKMMTLMRECYMHLSKHDRWPTTLDDLRAGGMDAKKLQTLLSAPDSKDGKSVIVYRQPKPDDRDVIIMYEAPEIRRKGFVVCGYMDGHAQLLTQKEFDAAMKKQEAAK